MIGYQPLTNKLLAELLLRRASVLSLLKSIQMKMFLTRMGESAKFVVTGDMSQVDLPRNQKSGLRAAENILRSVEGVSFVHLDEMDVIRHRLVKKIIRAFEENDDQASGNQVK